MALRDVVLDPDGDILVIVTLPKAPSNDPGPDEPIPDEIEFDQTEPPPPPLSPLPPEDVTDNVALIYEEYQPSAFSHREEKQWRAWREANEIHEDGLLHWGFDGFDVNAISTILSIIHGLNRRVPRTVDLRMLAQIARVVDYLDCHEVMELYASIWVNHLSNSTPGSSKEDWDSWISITGVFQNPTIFQSWTRVAIVEKLNYPPSLELPILSLAYDIIDQRRQLHLNKILSCVYDHVNRLSEQKTCSVECDAILLGTLIRQMHANSLPSLRPTEPYEGLSVTNVVKAIKGLSVPEWYSKVKEVEEPSQSAFEFWGATKKLSKMQQKKARLKSKRRAPSNDDWGFGGPVEEIEEEVREIVVNEHSCGFEELIATVRSLESEIKGLDLKKDLGIHDSEY
ncbi:hypothetical protein CIB48_g5387 [Xylaria polymorpha]|nr:hypothetical protein CIB48_g5387 [Xylaria polymorpha]